MHVTLAGNVTQFSVVCVILAGFMCKIWLLMQRNFRLRLTLSPELIRLPNPILGNKSLPCSPRLSKEPLVNLCHRLSLPYFYLCLVTPH